MMIDLEIPVWATVEDDGAEVCAESVSDFLQSFLPLDADAVWSPELFRWKLGASNPAGRGFLSVATVGDQVIATTSITPKRLWVDGKVIIGGEIGDTYTAEQFRRSGSPIELYESDKDPQSYVNKSVFGRLVAETRSRAESAGLQLIYGTPNQSSMPGYVKRLDFFHFNHMRCEAYIRIRSAGVFQRESSLRSVKHLVIGLDKLFSCALRSIVRLVTMDIQVQDAYPTDDEIDALWTQLNPNFNFTVVHDAAWFRFRYLKHPNASYQFLTLHHKGKLAGLMVFRRFRDMAGNMVLAVVDWLVAPKDKMGFARLISEGIEQFSSDVQSIHIWSVKQSEIASALPKLGFIKRGEVPIIFTANSEAQLLHSNNIPFEISIGASDNV